MAMWLLSFLLIAGTFGSQTKRQRVSRVTPGQAARQEEGAAAVGVIKAGGHQADCLFLLLPWALVLGISFALYTLFTQGQQGGKAGADLDITTEEELLGEILGVLWILQGRLWQMVRERRKQQHHQHCSKAKGAAAPGCWTPAQEDTKERLDLT
ncbi:hypothetical protein JRQ81_004586 [Phrynocephalus forsythii]|uniref:Uncharacterized protein n=1 Tax=Phrynocephalus forsythii TaxID=171643 RepID=A0A9Q0XHF9_9SAUR|nr:hypothetical protein JRQ81_004586 [Phrynocephalus forsythii]